MPSLFDAADRHRRAAIAFLRNFAVDVAKISDPNDRQHLDYVPTQIVGEFLRYHLDRRVDGVRWRSTKNANETSTVLFVENDACVDADSDWMRSRQDGDLRVVMDPASLERIEPVATTFDRAPDARAGD